MLPRDGEERSTDGHSQSLRPIAGALRDRILLLRIHYLPLASEYCQILHLKSEPLIDLYLCSWFNFGMSSVFQKLRRPHPSQFWAVDLRWDG